MIRTFKTNLHCESCLDKLRPGFANQPGLRWSVDFSNPDHTLTVEGEDVSPMTVKRIVSEAGFEADEVAVYEVKTSYYPLTLIVAYLIAITACVEIAAGQFDLMRAMATFMAGFFLAFSFFKLLDVKGFADSFAMYDLVAKRSRSYALVYPFIELALGLAYLMKVSPTATNTATLIVMLVGAAGVVESLVNKRRVKCACLGSVFNLPMSSVTLIEDVSMAVMAFVMLVLPHG
jgi:hypothetical protein